MENLPSSWDALAAVVFLLGLKHGFDGDHLATIDGLTRLNSRRQNAFARYCGALFSLGHGLVALSIALLIGTASAHWQAPEWLNTTGASISILVLTILGIANLRAVFAADPQAVVGPVGLKGPFLERISTRLSGANRPILVVLVGALFALSFDVFSLAALFALAGARLGGLSYILLLGVLFTLGMLVTDGINGLWIARLIARSDQLARVASRAMSLAIAGVSLLVAAFAAARLLAPRLAAWGNEWPTLLGAGVLAVSLLGFYMGRALAPARVVVAAETSDGAQQ